MGDDRNTGLESVRVARLLRDDIMLGRRLPGARLIERDIAAELEVSRLPVREAIKTLVAEGIVVSRPRTWATVREFSEKDIHDFAEVRESIETLAWVLATQRLDDERLALFERLIDAEEAAAAAGDVDAARRLSAEVHMTAVRLSGNEMLIELAASLVTRLRWLFGQHDDLAGMAVDHRAILEAMQAGDVEAVRRIIPQHLAQGRDAAIARLFGRQGIHG